MRSRSSARAGPAPRSPPRSPRAGWQVVGGRRPQPRRGRARGRPRRASARRRVDGRGRGARRRPRDRGHARTRRSSRSPRGSRPRVRPGRARHPPLRRARARRARRGARAASARCTRCRPCPTVDAGPGAAGRARGARSPAIRRSRRSPRSSSCRPVAVDDADRARYHAAACIASNHLVALLDQVERVAPVPLEAFLPLVRATLDNVADARPGRRAHRTGRARRRRDGARPPRRAARRRARRLPRARARGRARLAGRRGADDAELDAVLR